MDGTSYAAPHVAGAAAVIKSFLGGVLPNQVEYLIEQTADDVNVPPWMEGAQGAGRLNLWRAMDEALIDMDLEFHEGPPLGKVAAGSEEVLVISWEEYDIMPFYRYRLYRKIDGGVAEQIWSEWPFGPHYYWDEDISPGHTYSYSVQTYSWDIWHGISVQGASFWTTYDYSGGGGPEDESIQLNLPAKLELDQNYPNPFNPTTQIRFGLPNASQVQLRILNSRGQTVKVLIDGEKSAGWYTVTWDSKDSDGRDVASGIYLYYLKVEGKRLLKKMTLIR